ncbi:C-type lectin domain family 12 member A [Eptesicus fuscus]|uniref:C-type lectin domain family 12 member A n=1 Tax=Eptesicus fuscus TaxID=29078 RepID=UPI0024046F97|nr:C-type lectin domain family 12 member A [Eptesicus fuscus]XP_054574499.1 C-type lectin domain family 12 member A [Eptesicus fuscus]XP_054574500.1 C-type lectin domain family 12 member A [Eptesicus fuscus]XP_054574501.1 C-type lectin domain family 12 member A [Eptesicus fuscus]
MSEEVTYADLKFQDSSETENIQEFDQVGVKAPPAPSHVWRQRALAALILLCLLLLIGLGVLGSIFYLSLKIEMEKLEELQNFKDKLQNNVSLQLTYNMDSLKKIRNLSSTLQEMATKLCYELYQKEPEHKCKPCPEKWMWHEDRCYGELKKYETWKQSDLICSIHNASLVKIKNKSVLEFIKSKKFYNYWLGLSPREDYKSNKDLDETIISSDWFTGNTIDLNGEMYCGYIHYMYVYYDTCTNKKNVMCEKLPNPVKIESILMNEKPDGRM